MQYLWKTHGKTEVPYEIPDLQAAVATVTDDESFAQNFFQQYIYDSQLPDLSQLLNHFGLIVKAKPDHQVAFRTNIDFTDGKAIIKGNVPHGGALHEAGCTKGDVIASINGKPITHRDELEALTKELQVGESYPIQFVQNGIETEGTFTAQADPRFEVLSAEEAGARISKELGLRRKAWLKQ